MNSAPTISSPTLTDALSEYFGYGEFRPLQQEAVQAQMDGRDVLVVMPTGAGKSLCFQLPAALTPGVTLVVSPLVALMRDQVDALLRRPAFARLGVAALSSLQSLSEQMDVLDSVRAGRIRLLYVAPERFRSNAFRDALRVGGIARLVVDEAHCISEWGHDFRPDYLSLRESISRLGDPPVTAVTATATRRVQESILANLGMRDPEVLVGGFNRPNLHLSVHKCKGDNDRVERLARALPKLLAGGGSGLIYGATRRQCEELAEVATQALRPYGLAAGLYHAGLDPETRNAMQARWLSGELPVLAATNAFGMGIDKADVRFVVHCACPDSLESYYQEAGRAGRDGGKARCVILYHFSDRKTREWFIENEALTTEDVRKAHLEIARHAKKDDLARLPRLWAMRAFDWSEVKSRLALSELERAGLIARHGETGDDLTLRLLSRDFPPSALKKIDADLQRQRGERYRRLDEVIDYCKTTACRRRTVLDYFGDPEPPLALDGRCCDNCDHPPKLQDASRAPATGRVPMPPPPVNADIYTLLQALDALRPSLGRSRLNQLLRGASSQSMERFQNENHPLYGALTGANKGWVDRFLDRLIEDGLMHQGDEDEYFVCTITLAGRAAWQERRPLDIAVPSPKAASPRSRGGQEPAGGLFEALRAWRWTESKQAEVPPYVVFSDKTLHEIAALAPRSLGELAEVSGVGPRKLEQYGDAVLEIIHQSQGQAE